MSQLSDSQQQTLIDFALFLSAQNQTEENSETLQNVITEPEIEKLLGVTKDQLATLRTRGGLPFIKINNRSRLYFESDLISFFRDRRVRLNSAGIDD